MKKRFFANEGEKRSEPANVQVFDQLKIINVVGKGAHYKKLKFACWALNGAHNIKGRFSFNSCSFTIHSEAAFITY